jgi:two-component system, NarL family, nitrate/nitrite response regulator NarL
MQSCLICDDHALMRSALSGAIGMGWPDAMIATAADFPGAWLGAANGHSLILCDLSMPGADPLTGIAGMRRAAPKTPLIVITGNEDDALLIALFDVAIDGFIPKSASGQLIEAAIRLVLAGGRYLPRRVIELARDRDSASERPCVRLADNGIARLTERQIDILKRMARGDANKEIARDLCLSPATVKAHVAAVTSALGASNRTEAAFRAREIGLI